MAEDVDALFERLSELTDKQVMRVMAFTMAQTLASGTGVVETLGAQLDVDMSQWWKSDETFFNLLRDKQGINAMLGEVAGQSVADANITSTAKVQKGIIRDCLHGTEHDKVDEWMPRYMSFPMTGYTQRFA